MKMRYILLILVVALAGCASQEPSNSTQMANPASVHCEEQGGTIEIVDTEEGMVGMCHLPDGQVCEEWAYYEGECDEHVSNFSECVAAGYPVEESFPRRCRAHGEVFTEPIPLREQCRELHGGRWIEQFDECEGITQEACAQMDGTFEGCASACRHNQDAEMCTAQCVPVCGMSD